MNTLAIAFLLLMGDVPPPASEPEIALPIRCNAMVCQMPKDLAIAMVEAHNAQVDKIIALEKQLADIRAAKGCAKVEVPKLKKERDA